MKKEYVMFWKLKLKYNVFIYTHHHELKKLTSYNGNWSLLWRWLCNNLWITLWSLWTHYIILLCLFWFDLKQHKYWPWIYLHKVLFIFSKICLCTCGFKWININLFVELYHSLNLLNTIGELMSWTFFFLCMFFAPTIHTNNVKCIYVCIFFFFKNNCDVTKVMIFYKTMAILHKAI
jgi:hypothetical protein